MIENLKMVYAKHINMNISTQRLMVLEKIKVHLLVCLEGKALVKV